MHYITMGILIGFGLMLAPYIVAFIAEAMAVMAWLIWQFIKNLPALLWGVTKWAAMLACTFALIAAIIWAFQASEILRMATLWAIMLSLFGLLVLFPIWIFYSAARNVWNGRR